MTLRWFRLLTLSFVSVSIVLCNTLPTIAVVLTGRELVEVNSTKHGDACPTISPNGLELYFWAWKRTPGRGEDLWLATRGSTAEVFGQPVSLGDPFVSGDAHPEISSDGLSLYFTGETGERKDGFGSEDLWMTTREDLTAPWKSPVNLGPTINTLDYEGRPSLSADELILVYDRNHSNGDIWMATRETSDEPFGSLVDVGIDGWAPEISPDGLSLYFGNFRNVDAPEEGEDDLFVARRTTRSEPFGEPINLGLHINTKFADICPNISADGSTLYISRGSYLWLANASESILSSADLWEVPLDRTSHLTVIPDSLYGVFDNDGTFDNLGDSAEPVLEKIFSSVGEESGRVSRLVTKFELPERSAELPQLKSATLRFLLSRIIGIPPGPLSILHSVTDNDLEMLASDYENETYLDVGLELIQATDEFGRYYDLDVTKLVEQDYASDEDTPLSAFRLQINEAVFASDTIPNIYRLTMPNGKILQPQLILTFVPEPSMFFLTAISLLSLVGFARNRVIF